MTVVGLLTTSMITAMKIILCLYIWGLVGPRALCPYIWLGHFWMWCHFWILPIMAINLLLQTFCHHSRRGKQANPHIHNPNQHVFCSRRGKGIMPWLIFCAMPQHQHIHWPSMQQSTCFFAIQRGDVANPQYATINLLLLFFAIPEEGKGGNNIPAAPINPQCNNQPVVFYFLPFGRVKGDKPAMHTINLLFLFFIPEGEMRKCHVDCLSQEAKTSEKQNSMLSFLIYMYQKTILKKYWTWNGIYVWCTAFGVAFGNNFYKNTSDL